MKSHSAGLIGLLLIVIVAPATAQTPVDAAFTYQGQLRQDGTPVNDTCDCEFSLWDDASTGTQLGSVQSFIGVEVYDGLFTVELNGGGEFGPDAFIGEQRWLEISVACPSGEALQLLSPRQKLTAAPFAQHALNGGGDGWGLAGNGGTDPATNFLGTTDDIPFEIRVNDARALRIEYAEGSRSGGPVSPAPNVLAGSPSNEIEPGVFCATIAGGGFDDGASSVFPNRVTHDYGTVGGGLRNTAGFTSTVGGGYSNSASWTFCTIGGGQGNSASGISATVAGGDDNAAGGHRSTVGGGASNAASGHESTVGGGIANTASGLYSTVPGGTQNTAQGYNSFAAGIRAKALHDGAFVWSDDGTADFQSTAENQFLIQATRGVGIGTNAPTSRLTVAGRVESTAGGFRFPDGTTQTTAVVGPVPDGHSLDAADGGPSDALYVDNNGKVGIGTTNPTQKLDVEGAVRASGVVYSESVVTGGVTIPLTAYNGVIASSVFDDLSISNFASTDIVFNTGPSPGLAFELMRITNDGKVGIGTSDPLGALHVDGSTPVVRIYDAYLADGQKSMLRVGKSDSSNEALGIEYLQHASQSMVSLHFFGDVFGDSLILQKGGNVGIGTTAPASKLHVSGGTGSVNMVLEADTDNANEGDQPSFTITQDGGAVTSNLGFFDAVNHFSIRTEDASSGVSHILLEPEGRVGIGTASPASGFLLDVAGNIRCVGLTQTSSRSLKENITPIEGALETVDRLQGVRFTWTAEHGGQPDLGFIAEDVAEVLPELVTWHEDGREASGLKYGHLTAVAVEAIKELRAEVVAKDAEITSQREAIKQLQTENADSTARLERLEAAMAKLAEQCSENGQ